MELTAGMRGEEEAIEEPLQSENENKVRIYQYRDISTAETRYYVMKELTRVCAARKGCCNARMKQFQPRHKCALWMAIEWEEGRPLKYGTGGRTG